MIYFNVYSLNIVNNVTFECFFTVLILGERTGCFESIQ